MAQVYYTTRPDYIQSKTENNNLLTAFENRFPDTSVAAAHLFLNRNFSGNFGLPSPTYTAAFGSDALGFRLAPRVYPGSQYLASDVQFHLTKGPFASVTGIAGSRQLQMMQLLFTQTFKSRLNLSFRFNRFSSAGFYRRQQASANNFYASSHYTSKSSRAGFYFYFLSNSHKHQENGGIGNPDSLTALTYTLTKAILPVRLSQASRDNREFSAMLNPWIKLNRATDTLQRLNCYFQVKSVFQHATYQYKDPALRTDAFYRLMYFDTLSTFDSTRVLKLSNDASLSFSRPGKNFGFSAGYRNEISEVWQHYDSALVNHLLTGDLRWRLLTGDSLSSFFQEAFHAETVLNGAAEGNYKIENRLSFQARRVNLFLNLLSERRNPDQIYNYWASNHFLWQGNGFTPTQTQQAEAGLRWKKRASLTFFAQNIGGYLYFDEYALPAQISGNGQTTGLTASYSLTLLRHLGIYAAHTWQTSSTRTIPLPGHISCARLFYTGSHFRNNLQLNIGLQGERYQAFYAYDYMPSTQAFFLQTRRLSGDYPYLDFYLNARIRPVTVFFKAENVLYKFAGPDYYFAPGYYQPDRAFRLGITWMFFD